ncbi:MAG: mechanosensitive ion channel [Moorea sp. SIO2B7]|nr:mechanosensitive ion channel [Moorena sp. SIO2B7]
MSFTRFWRRYRRRNQYLSHRLQRKWEIILLAIFTLLLILVVPVQAQNTLDAPTEKAPVVLDGQFLFHVGTYGNSSAAQRAEVINAALEEEVRSPENLELVLKHDTEKQKQKQTSIRSKKRNRHLLSVTQADVIQGTSPDEQAKIWKGLIEQAIRKGKYERTDNYQRQALLFSCGVLLGAIALQVGSMFLGRFLSHQITRWFGNFTSPFHPWEEPARLFLRLALLGLQVGLWIAVSFYLSDIFPIARIWRYNLSQFINSPVILLGETKYSALGLLLLLALTIGLWFGISSLTQLFKSYVLVKTGADSRAQDVIAILTKYILTFLGLIILLQIWGIDVRSLAILASVLGVGIGFGVQNIANNFISGLIITLERPIQVGDFVNLGDLVGTVKRIGARSTEISTLDQVTILVPNSRFLESEVINWSHGDPVSRLKIPVGIAYGSDIEKVKIALLRAAKSHPEVLLRPRPQVWFQEFADNSLNFEILVWIGDPKKQFRVKSDLNYRIEESLRRYGIEVPFPQRDINLRSPQLEILITAWLRKYDPEILEKNFIAESIEDVKEEQPQAQSISGEYLSEQFSDSDLFDNDLDNVDIEDLVVTMRGSEGLEIKDRRYRLNTYPDCFIGSEAVDWLVQKHNCMRSEAVKLGQRLVDRGIIHHVTDEHPFEDDYLFYRFYADEPEIDQD